MGKLQVIHTKYIYFLYIFKETLGLAKPSIQFIFQRFKKTSKIVNLAKSDPLRGRKKIY